MDVLRESEKGFLVCSQIFLGRWGSLGKFGLTTSVFPKPCYSVVISVILNITDVSGQCCVKIVSSEYALYILSPALFQFPYNCQGVNNQ